MSEPKKPAASAPLEVRDLLSILEAVWSPRRKTLRGVSLALAIADGGAFVLEPTAEPVVQPGWKDDTELAILTNRKTLSDWLSGRFDPSRPGPEHLFVHSGAPASWKRLHDALDSGHSALGAQLKAAAASGDHAQQKRAAQKKARSKK